MPRNLNKIVRSWIRLLDCSSKDILKETSLRYEHDGDGPKSKSWLRTVWTGTDWSETVRAGTGRGAGELLEWSRNYRSGHVQRKMDSTEKVWARTNWSQSGVARTVQEQIKQEQFDQKFLAEHCTVYSGYLDQELFDEGLLEQARFEHIKAVFRILGGSIRVLIRILILHLPQRWLGIRIQAWK